MVKRQADIVAEMPKNDVDRAATGWGLHLAEITPDLLMGAAKPPDTTKTKKPGRSE
jgi:hypothetical protein